MEWCAANIFPEKENLQHHPKRYFPNWINKLAKGREIYVNNTHNLNNECGSRKRNTACAINKIGIGSPPSLDKNIILVSLDLMLFKVA